MENFVEACSVWLGARPEPVCHRAAQALRTALDRGIDPVDHGDGTEPPALVHLPSLLEAPGRDGLADALGAVAADLRWFEPPAENLQRYLGGRNCMTQLLGPHGREAAQGPRFGTFLIAPGAVYPRHAHGAEELYLILSGSGRWSYDGEPYSARHAGEVVHSQSWQPHAIRTDDAALLMAWIWMGDVSFDSYRMEADGFDDKGEPI
jgi:mannose-6-phosphate isomerase-like protein (cupin superfamily)